MRHLLPRPQQRLLSQLRSNPFTLDDDDDDNGSDSVDLQVGFRRPKISSMLGHDGILDQDNLSDHAIVRLAVARARAMERYHEINGKQKG